MEVLKHEGFRGVRIRAMIYAKNWRTLIANAGDRSISVVAAEPKYNDWIRAHEQYDQTSIKSEIKQFDWKPKISIITPVHNVAPVWLDRCILSVLNQSYENWEMCLHDDGSTQLGTVARMVYWAGRDQRIKVSLGQQNEGISEASNKALAMATGHFVGLLDHDDELSCQALYEVVRLLNEYPDTDLVYTDEDKLSELKKDRFFRHDPFFKPDWDPHFLMASMYVGHFSVYRKEVMEQVGGFRSQYDFSQDYDLVLRVTEKTNNIRHISKILYHWRTVAGSAALGEKSHARASNLAALGSAIRRRGYSAEVLEYPFANRVRFLAKEKPQVSIIIPSDNCDNIFMCLDHLFSNTSYSNYEAIIVTKTSLGEVVSERYGADRPVRIFPFDEPFNFSKKCNQGVKHAKGEYVLFLKDNVHAVHESWIEDMLEVFGKGSVGAVSPRMFSESDTIHHAGMVTGVRGLIGTPFQCRPKDSGEYHNMILSPRSVSLLSSACMMMPKAVFEEIGGFDEVITPIMDSDVDLCCKLKSRGYELIYQPFACLRHVGPISIGQSDTDEIEARKKHLTALFVLKRWGEQLSDDPYYPQTMRQYLYENGSPYYRLYASRQDDRLISAPNILIVSHDLSLSGAPLIIYNLACDMMDRGYFVTVMSPSEGVMGDRFRERNIPVMIDASLRKDFHRETKKFMAHFDLIVASTITVYQAVHASKELGVPVVWLIHESEFGCELVQRSSEAADAFRLADAVVMYCREASERYKRVVKEADIQLLTLGIKPLEETNHKKPKDAAFVILNVGSIEERKGQDTMVRSILGLPEELSEQVKVYLVGRILEPFFFEKIKRLTEDSKWDFTFVGEVPHHELASWYDMANVVVCSSRDETGPMTVLEAMSRGKATISTRVGSVADMISDGEDGLIIPPNNVPRMTESIELLYKDQAMRERLGKSALDKFTKKLTFNRFSAQFIRIVENYRLHRS